MSLTARAVASYYWPVMARKSDARIRELERLIKKHQDLYYNGQPELSDAEFDELWDELARLDPGNSIFGVVGADEADGWPKARHLIPMGSQEKASNPEDFLAWCAKVAHPEYLVQYKLDGASLELQYEGGVLVRAVTRGNGTLGDDITPNASRMGGVVTGCPWPSRAGYAAKSSCPTMSTSANTRTRPTAATPRTAS
jgi:DNA ligase (NAD+)